MLHVHLSNRHEVLAARLLTQLQGPATGGLADVFEAREVVVPSLALRRALTLELSRFEGVCAQVRFEFLAPWLWSRLAGPGPRQSPFAAAGLTWRAYQAFADPGFVAAHPRLAAYLGGADALMHFELAGRSAALLEQYTTYRADGLRAWSAGQPWPETDTHPDAGWQAALWRRVSQDIATAEGLPADPGAQALLRSLPQRAANGPSAAALARPAHIFGLPTIAPLHLQWLQQLARHAEIHLYVLNPCQEHWFDLVDPRRLAQLRAQGQAQGFEVGHRLLSTWGRQTQAHLQALVEAGDGGEADSADYVPGPPGPLLSQLQNSILALREPGPGSFQLATGDRSLEVHVCHSLTRQLEVLHSHLLGVFAAAEAGGRPLPPGRVLVAVPDLEAAAPLIDAVFGTAPRERQLPYLITGRARSQDEAPARALLGLLALAGSRWAASDVFALLQQPLVARRFGLLDGQDDAPLQQVREWLQQAGIRWGEDAAHRAALGLPPSNTHTWADGLARLFLGYAMPAEAPAAHAHATDDAAAAAEPWAGLLPAGRPEGLQAQALGSLWAFVQALAALRTQTARPLPPAAWGPLLLQTLPTFLQAEAGDGDGSTDALLALQAAITGLSACWQASGLATPLPLAVVRAALAEQLDASAPGGVPGGAITFAAMASLRGLPYDVVCVLGLDDGVWPSAARPLEFDLMAAHPRRGDRQRRNEDRNVFLDLLLAARRSLFLACTGRSLRDNTALTPSVLVTELLDLLGTAILPSPAAATDPAARAQARARLVVEHPLQPFALAAFDASPGADPRLRSGDTELAQALQASLRNAPPPTAPPAGANAADDSSAGGGEDSEDSADDDTAPELEPPFFTAALPPAGDAERQVDWPQFVAFFRHPSRALLRQRLGIVLARDAEALADDEAFVPDAPTRRALAGLLLPALLAGAPPAQAAALARAGTAWPPGELGAAALDTELRALQAYAQRVRAATQAPLLPPLQATLGTRIDGADWRLAGALADLRTTGLVRWRHAPASGADLLEAWLHHLLLCLGLQQAGHSPLAAPATTTWMAADRDWVFDPVAAPQAELLALLQLYAQGQREPLHLYPRTAWAWVDKPGTQAARSAWAPSRFKPHAEGADAHHRLALRGLAEPLDAAFEAQAEAVFGPLRRHLRGLAHEDSDDDA
jgi:exodeoxyribonuclease V gamma subunit